MIELAPTGPSILETLGPEKVKLLLESWKPHLEAVRQAKNGWEDEKAVRLAIVLENTRNQFDYAHSRGILNETTQVGDIATFKRFYFDVITAIWPNMIAQEIVSVQPLTQKIGQIFYLKYLYGSKKGAISKGDVMMDPLAGHNNSQAGIEYSSEVVTDELIGASGDDNYVGNFAYTPIRPGTIVIRIGNARVIDNGQGGFTATGVTLAAGQGNNVVDYLTGTFSINLSANTAADVEVDYEYNNEYAPAQVPEINIQVSQQTLTARSRKLKAYYAMDAAFDFKMQYGIDIDDTLLQTVSAEIMHEIDGEIMRDLYLMAGGTSTWSKTPPNAQINYRDHRELFIDELVAAGNTIFSSTQRVKGNFIIAGVGVSTVLESIGAPRFVASGRATNGPHLAGVLDGKWKVYTNPFYGQNEYLVGYKGELFLDAGYVFAPYLPLFATQLLIGEDFMGRRGFATSNAKRMVNSSMYIKGTLTS